MIGIFAQTGLDVGLTQCENKRWFITIGRFLGPGTNKLNIVDFESLLSFVSICCLMFSLGSRLKVT